MLSLVDYDASSESEFEEDSEKPITNTQQQQQNERSNDTKHSTLFASLPAPIKNDEAVEEDTDEFLNKKADVIERPPKRIKITVPKLNYFTEDIDTEVRPLKEKKKKCALFTILPAPKVVPIKTTHFLPNSLQKNTKPQKQSTANVTKAPEASKVYEVPKVPINRPPLSDSDSETEDSVSIPITTFDEQTWNNLFSKKKRIAVPKVKKPVVEQSDPGVIELAPDAEKPYTGLDNLAFKELIGKKKKEQQINVIEIEEAKIHPDREEWLKSLTDPCFEASPEIKEPVNRTSLVKNHIMSLAERALTNDKDLQIRWAESRHSRNQTRVKYGF